MKNAASKEYEWRVKKKEKTFWNKENTIGENKNIEIIIISTLTYGIHKINKLKNRKQKIKSSRKNNKNEKKNKTKHKTLQNDCSMIS